MTLVGEVFSALIIALGVAFLLLIARRLHDSSPAARRTLVPLVLAGAFGALEFITLRAADLTDWTQAYNTLNWIDRTTLLVLPVAIFAGSARIRRDRGPLGDLLVELTHAPADQIQPALARAVGDPSLRLALWLPRERRYVDCDGTPITVNAGEPGRAVTLVQADAQPVAAIVHDASLVEQRDLLEATGSAASLAFENARLQAELRAQMVELRASRARIVRAGDAERKRLERNLHDGAQQRLLAAGLALQLLADNAGNGELLAEARAELQAGLRRVARTGAWYPSRDPHRARPARGGAPASPTGRPCRSPSISPMDATPKPSKVPPTLLSPKPWPTSPNTPTHTPPTSPSNPRTAASSSKSATTAAAAPTSRPAAACAVSPTASAHSTGASPSTAHPAKGPP